MCGIVGAVAQRNVVPILIEGLRKLEYRGYDSAGLALLDPEGHMNRVRAVGRVAELDTRAKEKHADAPTGIAHTRWATHGGVNEGNAHPHISTGSELQISVVHNGIIENHEELRSALKAKGYEFTSQTDTEVVAHLVHSLVLGGLSLTDAVAKAIKQLHGAYALAVISSREPAGARPCCWAWVAKVRARARTSSPPTPLPCCRSPSTSSTWKKVIWPRSPATATPSVTPRATW